MTGAIRAVLREMPVACEWKLSVRHRERMVEPAPAQTKCSLASAPGQGLLLPGAAGVSPDLELEKCCRKCCFL